MSCVSAFVFSFSANSFKNSSDLLNSVSKTGFHFQCHSFSSDFHLVRFVLALSFLKFVNTDINLVFSLCSSLFAPKLLIFSSLLGVFVVDLESIISKMQGSIELPFRSYKVMKVKTEFADKCVSI